MKNKCAYDRKTLIDIMKSYLIQIKRDGKTYPAVVLDDLRVSLEYVIKKAEEN